MPATEKPHRLTVTIDDPEISDAIRQAADERRTSTREIVAEVLRKWLEEREMELDRIAARKARADAEPITDFDDYVAERSRRA